VGTLAVSEVSVDWINIFLLLLHFVLSFHCLCHPYGCLAPLALHQWCRGGVPPFVEACHPPWWFPPFLRRFRVEAHRVFPTLLPNCGWVWLPDPIPTITIKTRRILLFTTHFLYIHLHFLLALPLIKVWNKMKTTIYIHFFNTCTFFNVGLSALFLWSLE